MSLVGVLVGLVEGNRYDTGIAAQIVTHKYSYHLPGENGAWHRKFIGGHLQAGGESAACGPGGRAETAA